MYGYKKKLGWPFFVAAAPLSIVFEIIAVFIMLHLMDSLAFEKQNMLGVGQVLLVGTGFFVIYGLVEMLIRRGRDMSWIRTEIGLRLIPMAVELVIFIAAFAAWRGEPHDEHRQFFMYLFGVLCLYLFVSFIMRCVFELILAAVDSQDAKRTKKDKDKGKKRK